MNNIGLIISGNLTGFSRFYASPNANDIYNEAKFDFDYRNFLTFLNNDDKAYAISFAPTVISVSLVTRILDSFRRPGVLVVSILLPRNKKVESAMNSQNNKALYQLLNAIHDTFRKKNFVNGMVNQNAAVLMQDYYTDILSNFVLVPDGLQRPINSRIDVSSPNKRLGYVKSTEDNVPLYLSSLCRKSYESYHHVFIAENAPQNIDEEPVEVVFYNVRITNDNHTIPSVKLTDKIPNVRPGEGEIDIENKNYTYQQALNGEAGRNIVATIVGETIEISYRFGKETKEVHFTFTDGNNVIPFASICPKIVYADGRIENIGSETWTFEGKEIYERKTIESGNSNYTIKRECSNLDTRRYKSGAQCIIQVEQRSPIDIKFPAPYNKRKTITFKRSNNLPITVQADDFLYELLPGRLEEYSYTIDSDYYERVTGKLPPLGVQVNIELKAKTEKRVGLTTKRSSSTNHVESSANKTTTSVKGVNSGGVLKLESNNNRSINKPQKNNKKKYYLFGSLAVSLVVILLLFAKRDEISNLFGGKTADAEVVAADDFIEKDLILSFVGSDNQPIESISKYGFTYNEFSKYVNIYVSPKQFVQKTDSVTGGSFQLTYHIVGNASEIRDIEFTVSVARNPITSDGKSVVIKASDLLDVEENSKEIEIKLNVKSSEISLYNELSKITNITDDEKEEFEKRVKAITNKDFAEPLKKILGSLHPQVSKKESSNKDVTKVKSETKTSTSNKSDNSNASIPTEIKDRIIRGGAISPDIISNYTGEQQSILNEYNFFRNKWNKNIPKEVQEKFKPCKTFKDIQKVARENKNPNS